MRSKFVLPAVVAGMLTLAGCDLDEIHGFARASALIPILAATDVVYARLGHGQAQAQLAEALHQLRICNDDPAKFVNLDILRL